MRTAPLDRKLATIAIAFGLLALGVLNLVYQDLLLQWQPAPKDASWRTLGGVISGLVLVIAGVGLFITRLRRHAALLGAAWIALWVLFLHLPVAIVMKGAVVALLGIAESSAMAIGLALLAFGLNPGRIQRVLVVLFGVCLVIFGISHFVYAEFTATMVPAWLPARLGIAYLTGVIHALTGVCLLIGRFVTIAAAIEAAMMTSFVVLLHIPHVIATPTNRAELTMLAVAFTLSSAAWVVAAVTRGGSRVRDDGFIHVIG